MDLFKNRTIGFWIQFAASVIMFAGAIAFYAVDYGDRTFSWITCLLIFAGVIFEAAAVCTNYDAAPLLNAVCFGVALAYHLYIGLPTLSDILNGVNFIGGNADAVIIFSIVFFIGMAGSVAGCFMKQRKECISIE